mmetsp:Transcript_1435/g.3235  ORF Transcript_1435/g.3235 Transcript_1435/m.3235 type:complete len:243 (+) Transcript_1435:907-1635(+)
MTIKMKRKMWTINTHQIYHPIGCSITRLFWFRGESLVWEAMSRAPVLIFVLHPNNPRCNKIKARHNQTNPPARKRNNHRNFHPQYDVPPDSHPVHSAFTPYPTSFPPTNPIPTHHPPRSPTTHLVNNAPQPPWHGVHPTTPPVIPPEDPPDSSPSDWLGAVAAVAWESSASGPDPMPFPARNKESSARLPEWAPGPRQWREWLPREEGLLGLGVGLVHLRVGLLPEIGILVVWFGISSINLL